MGKEPGDDSPSEAAHENDVTCLFPEVTVKSVGPANTHLKN